MTDLTANWTTVITSFLASLAALGPMMVMMHRNHKLMNSRLDQLIASKEAMAEKKGNERGVSDERARVASQTRKDKSST